MLFSFLFQQDNYDLLVKLTHVLPCAISFLEPIFLGAVAFPAGVMTQMEKSTGPRAQANSVLLNFYESVAIVFKVFFNPGHVGCTLIYTQKKDRK